MSLGFQNELNVILLLFAIVKNGKKNQELKMKKLVAKLMYDLCDERKNLFYFYPFFFSSALSFFLYGSIYLVCLWIIQCYLKDLFWTKIGRMIQCTQAHTHAKYKINIKRNTNK